MGDGGSDNSGDSTAQLINQYITNLDHYPAHLFFFTHQITTFDLPQ